ncbi:cytochrome b/b6 domain-containing protein [bacterium]|nr:cytochrome b/b6 domain-containing protein [bacterium]
MTAMNETDYSTKTKIFHWLTALLVVSIIPLGILASDAPFETDAQIATKTLLFSMHKTLGVAVFLVALARIAYALTQTKPAPLHPERRVETLLAEVVHWLLYISLVLVPLTGWVHHSAAAASAPIWIPFANHLPFIPVDPTVSDFFGGLHWLWSKVMVVSILLHFAGAMKHHVIDKDETLRRMWFGHNAYTARAQGVHRNSAMIALAIYAAVAGIGASFGILGQEKTISSPSLSTVSSEWTVQDGTIAISVTQLGNVVTGQFDDWTAAITFDENATGSVGSVETTINVGTLTLGSVSDQAMGKDFFDLVTFPIATFTADLVKLEGVYLAEGTLAIKGARVPVTLPFDLTLDADTATMVGTVSLDRRDFAIGESMADESNLGFGVDVTINLTATR